MILKETTLKDLHNLGLISTHTANVLKSLGIVNIGSVRNYIDAGHKLLNIPKFGKKSEYEINRVLADLKIEEESTSTEEAKFNELNDVERECFDIALKSVVSSNNRKVDEYVKKIYDKPFMLFCKLFYYYSEIIKIVPELSLEENIIFRKYHILVMQTFIQELNQKKYYSHNKVIAQKSNIINYLKQQYEKFSCDDIVEYFLSSKHKIYIERNFEILCNSKLSVRANNFRTEYIKTYDILVRLFDKPISSYYSLCPGHIFKKTINEIYCFNQKFKEFFFDVCKLDELEVEQYEIKQKFPFLSSNQRKFIFDYKENNNTLPVFYILYNYLRISEQKADLCYSMYYGILDGQSKSVDEIAELLNYSRERIRQILNGVIPAGKIDVYDELDLQQYNSLFSKSIICENDKDLVLIKEREHINCSFFVFAGLARLLFDYVILYIETRNIILVKRSVSENINLERLVSNLKTFIDSKYKEDTLINVKDIIKLNVGNEYSGTLLLYIADNVFNLETRNNGDILFRQNFIDVETEIYKILEDNGKPMHVEDIFYVFKTKFPNHKIIKSSQIKNSLLHSSRIKAIGKSSTYALSKWNNVYFGSIRQLLIEILSKSSEPIHIDELITKVLYYYPKTTRRSISSTLKSDLLERFVAFDGDFFGLSSKNYDAKYRLSDFNRKFSFDVRLQKYKEFVDKYHHLPSLSGGEIESSLWRWHYNVINGELNISQTQLKIFNDLLNHYKDLKYPQNGSEYSFHIHCIEYKNYLEQNNCLPTATKNIELYSWFRRSKENYKGYNDLRYDYMIELLDFINHLGFVI